MTRWFAALGLLLLTSPRASAGAPPLPPGKPAGVRHAELDQTTEIAVGVAVAAAIGVILASATSGSSPNTMTPTPTPLPTP